MTTGLVALALAPMMVLLVVSFWPGIIKGSVFRSFGFAGVTSVSLGIKYGDSRAAK